MIQKAFVCDGLWLGENGGANREKVQRCSQQTGSNQASSKQLVTLVTYLNKQGVLPDGSRAIIAVLAV
jgi:hypothetical protein